MCKTGSHGGELQRPGHAVEEPKVPEVDGSEV